MECNGAKLPKESFSSTEMHKSVFRKNKQFSKLPMSVKGCKISSKINHKCIYISKGEVTLESLADAVCYPNGTLKISSFLCIKINVTVTI